MALDLLEPPAPRPPVTAAAGRRLIEPRPALGTDAAEIAAVMVRVRRLAMPYLPEIYSPEQVANWMRRTVLAQTDVWVVELDQRLGGFISFVPRWVELLYVAPETQGRGIGSALLSKAKERNPMGLRL